MAAVLASWKRTRSLAKASSTPSAPPRSASSPTPPTSLSSSARPSAEQQRVTRAAVKNGVLNQDHEVRERKVYTLRNEDTAPRAVIVEHPVRAGYQLRNDVKPVE